MSPIPVIIDCDPGVDDALALILASQKKDLEILAVTTVAGNVDIDTTTRNAQLLASFLNLKCPISAGASQPLVKVQVTASSTHGTDGFGGHAARFSRFGLKERDSLSAFARMVTLLEQAKTPVTLIALGPLTNIATLCLARPDLKAKIRQISLMGGALTTGNVTARAEFNFYVDPEAAQIVMNSGIPILMAGLDVTLQASLGEADLAHLRERASARSELIVDILSAYQRADTAMHDPVAVLAITNPEMLEGEDCYVQVDTSLEGARGQSYREGRANRTVAPNCKVWLKLDRVAFLQEIYKILE